MYPNVHFICFLGGFACQLRHVLPLFRNFSPAGWVTASPVRQPNSAPTVLWIWRSYGLHLWGQIFSLILPNDWKGLLFEKTARQVLNPRVFKYIVSSPVLSLGSVRCLRSGEATNPNLHEHHRRKFRSQTSDSMDR
jgi:hypothetical protein